MWLILNIISLKNRYFKNRTISFLKIESSSTYSKWSELLHKITSGKMQTVESKQSYDKLLPLCCSLITLKGFVTPLRDVIILCNKPGQVKYKCVICSGETVLPNTKCIPCESTDFLQIRKSQHIPSSYLEKKWFYSHAHSEISLDHFWFRIGFKKQDKF